MNKTRAAWRKKTKRASDKKDAPEKNRARSAVGRAVARGELLKQPCEECGETNVQAHHTDYSKKLEVVWLCVKHHKEVHKS